MKRNNKKGFTIVELVIVIAVIAILSAVLIPTFGGITEKAQESKRDQAAKNALTSIIGTTDFTTKSMNDIDGAIVIDGYLYTVTDGNINDLSIDQEVGVPATGVEVLYCNAAHAANTTCAKCGK